MARLAILAGAVAAFITPVSAQDGSPPQLKAGMLQGDLTIDGSLTEPAWSAADAVDTFKQTDPAEGSSPSGRTIVRVLADAKTLVIGIVCEDSAPDRIVSFSVRRDATLTSEDHVRVVQGPSSTVGPATSSPSIRAVPATTV